MTDWTEAQEAIELLAGKWVLAVLAELEAGPRRHNELFRTVDAGVSDRVLTDTLRRMERDGLIIRRTFMSSPPAVRYELTPLAHSLREPVSGLTGWLHEHRPTLERARARYDDEDLAGPDSEGLE